jgi:2'-5' RNA ligase
MPEDTYRELQKQAVNQLRVGSGQNLRASVVPIRSDYRTDSAMCLTSVAFLPDDIAHDIHRKIVQPLEEIEPDHHYYSPDSMHITVKNIRTIHNPPRFTEADVRKVDRLFGGLIPEHPSFSFWLEEVVPFPTSVSLIAYSDLKLRDLVRALDAGLNKIGVPDNKQYVSDGVYFGNVTLCRYTRQPSRKFSDALEQMTHVYKGVLKVEVIHLITCNSVCAPESSRILHSYRLRGSSAP